MLHRVRSDVRIRQSAPRPKPWVPTLGVRVLALLLLAVIGVGCPCIRGPVNASPALRWWLFSNFGAQRICPEMLKRSAPLALTPGTNTIGRFYPEQCSTVVNDATQTVTLNFAGSGLAWTPIGGRLGFQVSASIEYRMDFFMAEEGVYVWARPNRTLAGPDFKVLSVEYKVANWAAQGPAGYLVNTFGSQIVQAQLASGFTVVHTDDGDEFAIGQLQPPQRPPKPFATEEGRFIFANETTEVHAEQLDLLGPFEVVDSDQALYLRLFVKGPAVDVLVLYRGAGDLWRQQLQLGQPLGPPPQPALMTFAAAPNQDIRQRIPLPPGQYYVAIDNSSRVGTTNPPWNPLGVVGGNAAVVSYVAELGEADE